MLSKHLLLYRSQLKEQVLTLTVSGENYRKKF